MPLVLCIRLILVSLSTVNFKLLVFENTNTCTEYQYYISVKSISEIWLYAITALVLHPLIIKGNKRRLIDWILQQHAYPKFIDSNSIFTKALLCTWTYQKYMTWSYIIFLCWTVQVVLKVCEYGLDLIVKLITIHSMASLIPFQLTGEWLSQKPNTKDEFHILYLGNLEYRFLKSCLLARSNTFGVTKFLFCLYPTAVVSNRIW